LQEKAQHKKRKSLSAGKSALPKQAKPAVEIHDGPIFQAYWVGA